MKQVLGIVGLIVIMIVITVKAQDNKQLSEISKLRAENFKLKAQLNQCSLTTEQNILISTFRKELNAKDSDSFDWSSLTFNPTIDSK